MKHLRLIISPFIILSCLIASAANASVIYQWQQIGASPGIASSAGQLEVTNTAWQSGSLNFDAADFPLTGCSASAETCTIPNSPLLSFTFGNNTASPVSLSPRSYFPYDGNLELSLAFEPQGSVTGQIYANDTESDVSMSSTSNDNSIWNVGRFGSDNVATGCYEAPQCSGATGRWVIDPATTPTSTAVPEPAALGIFGLGLVGLLALARRRKAQSRG